jgi:hypothetical protein
VPIGKIQEFSPVCLCRPHHFLAPIRSQARGRVDSDKGPSRRGPELRLGELLGEYGELRDERLKAGDRKVQVASWLVVSHLQKRLLSSIEAFALTLRVHRRTLAKQAEKAAAAPTAAPRELSLLREPPGADDDRAELPEEEVRAEEESQVESATAASATGAGARLTSREEILLDQMKFVGGAPG